MCSQCVPYIQANSNGELDLHHFEVVMRRQLQLYVHHIRNTLETHWEHTQFGLHHFEVVMRRQLQL